jgi:hypothetical protein
MSQPPELPPNVPHNVRGCRAYIRTQAATISEQATTIAQITITTSEQTATIAAQGRTIEELGLEMEKLRKLLSRFVNGQRSEKRILSGPDQNWLPFDDSEEFQAARAEAVAQAEAIVQTSTVQREIRKQKPRDESLPSHLRREEQIIAGDASQSICPTHGERTFIGYDKTETLVHKRPELFVLVKKYPKYACAASPECGIASPERPTSLVGGTATTPAWRPRSSRPSGSIICRSIANRICSPGATRWRGCPGRPAVRRC